MRAGVIGVGWAGRQHLAAYSALPGVEVSAIAGLERDVRARLAAEHGVEHQTDGWEELLAVDGLDAVSIAVPTFLHEPIALAALERGLHVLCEKPLARTGAEAAAMVEAARRAGRVLDVAFNHRQRGDIQALKREIDAGRLGQPYYAKAWWLRRTGIPTMGSWFTSAELAGGGPLVDIGVHVLDYSLFLLGNPKVTAVSASTYDLLARAGFGSNPESSKTTSGSAGAFDVEDLATVFMRLDDGGTLLVEVGWAGRDAVTPRWSSGSSRRSGRAAGTGTTGRARRSWRGWSRRATAPPPSSARRACDQLASSGLSFLRASLRPTRTSTSSAMAR